MSKSIVPPKRWQQSHHFDDAISHPWYQLLFQLSSSIVYATYHFFEQKKYAVALPPVTCGSVTSPMGLGSDSLPVKIQLFDEPTYLADSMQFHLEYLLRHGNKGVFYIMPSFRGEDYDERHLNQFVHIEAEIVGGFSDIKQCINEYLFYLINFIYQHYHDDLIKIVDVQHIEKFLSNGMPKEITFNEALILLKNKPQYVNTYDRNIIGLTHLGEKKLMEELGEGIWLTHLPRKGVPFYQANAEDPNASLAGDFLAGIGEMIGCGERHTHAMDLVQAMNEREVSSEEYNWYIQLKEKYPLQTAGFGIGFERLLLWILKHDDIRDIPLIQRLKNQPSVP